MQFSVPLIFPDCTVWYETNFSWVYAMYKSLSNVNANVFITSIFKNGKFYLKYHLMYYLCQNSPIDDIHLGVNCYVSIFNFNHQNTKSTNVLYICNIFEKLPKALLKPFLIDVHRVKFLRRPQDASFWAHFAKCFSILYCFFWIFTTGKNIDMGQNTQRKIKKTFIFA